MGIRVREGFEIIKNMNAPYSVNKTIFVKDHTYTFPIVRDVKYGGGMGAPPSNGSPPIKLYNSLKMQESASQQFLDPRSKLFSIPNSELIDPK